MNGKKSAEPNQKTELPYSFIVFVLIAGIAALVINSVARTGSDFHNELWGPAHLLVQGKSPYDTSSLNAGLPAVWLPMAIGVFWPIGLPDEQAAVKIWFFINLVELGVIIRLATHNSNPALTLPIIGMAVYLFPPAVNHFTLGQFSITVMLCLIASAYLAEKRLDWWAAGFLALGLSKPQLGVLAVFGLAIFHLERDGIKRTVLFGLQVVLAGFILSLPLFVAYPRWIPDWIASMKVNSYPWLQPSVFLLLKRSMGTWGILIWGIITIVVLLVCHKMWMRMRPLTAMLWTLGLTTIVTPYVWGWDFVLLLPIWIHTFTQAGWTRKIFLLIVYAITWVGMVVILFSDNINNVRFWWVPLLLMAGIALASYYPVRHSAQGHNARR